MSYLKKTILSLSVIALLPLSISAKGTTPRPLHVKKILPAVGSEISADELGKYMPTSSSSGAEDAVSPENKNVSPVGIYLQKNRINRQTSWDDSGVVIYDFPRNPNGPDRNAVDWYNVAHNGAVTDSFIFISNQWTCPDHAVFQVYLGEYPFLNGGMEFNYIGNNTGTSASRFHLKPVYRDKYQKKHTIYSPAVKAVDASSLLIQSASGFKVQYNEARAVNASEREKRIVFKTLLSGISDTAGIRKITLERLAVIGGRSRFVGQLLIDGGMNNGWFIADVKDGQCAVSVLEVNDVLFDTRFYCAYAFGEGNMPDVYVWESSVDKVPGRIKEIFYKSDGRWVVTSTRREYSGDCFEERE